MVVHETIRGLLRPAGAELIGSALFVFIACGSAMTTVGFQIKGNAAIGIALTFGFTIFVLAYTIGHISGGHLNFAVTFTFCLLRKISILKCGLYFLAQFFGGLIGIGFLKLITPLSWWNVRITHDALRTRSCARVARGMMCTSLRFSDSVLALPTFAAFCFHRPQSCFATNVVQGELTVGHAFVAEFILTFMLMWVVMVRRAEQTSAKTSGARKPGRRARQSIRRARARGSVLVGARAHPSGSNSRCDVRGLWLCVHHSPRLSACVSLSPCACSLFRPRATPIRATRPLFLSPSAWLFSSRT